MRRTQKAGPGPAAPSQEHDPLRPSVDRKPLARYGAMEGALARGFFASIMLSRDALRNIGCRQAPRGSIHN